MTANTLCILYYSLTTLIVTLSPTQYILRYICMRVSGSQTSRNIAIKIQEKRIFNRKIQHIYIYIYKIKYFLVL